MGHYSSFRIGEHDFFLTREHYDPELAALFPESSRRHVIGRDEEGGVEYGYFTTALQLRQVLHVHGFTAVHARAKLEHAAIMWRDEEFPRGAEKRPPRDVDELIQEFCQMIGDARSSDLSELISQTERYSNLHEDLYALLWFMDKRSLVRILLEHTPDDMQVGLDLGQLTGCCVEMDHRQDVASPARAEQLASLSINAPLLVLTEGPSDSSLLSMAMEVTHPHLVGFIKFIDYAGTEGAEGSVKSLAMTVTAFIAAGIPNRFVAIADNDTAAHAVLETIKSRKMPAGCKVMHYPDLPFLASYPAVDSRSSEPTLVDINGKAGSLEMYLGKDVLTVDGQLVPVYWQNTRTHLEQSQGALRNRDKKSVQDAFEAKVRDARAGHAHSNADWSGITSIIEAIVHAFD